MMVPSMSEMTIESVESQTKIRAVHAAAPDAESEKVMLFDPTLRSSAFCFWHVGVRSNASNEAKGHRPIGLKSGGVSSHISSRSARPGRMECRVPRVGVQAAQMLLSWAVDR